MERTNIVKISSFLLGSLFLGLLTKKAFSFYTQTKQIDFKGKEEREGEEIGKEFVILALEIDCSEEGYVDAFYGDQSLRTIASKRNRNLHLILNDVISLKQKLNQSTTMQYRRKYFLNKQLIAMETFVRSAIEKREKGTISLTFDEESKNLYDAVAPHHTENDFEETLKKLDELLPQTGGSLIERYTKYKEKFIIPKDKLKLVFDTAIQEARERTKKYCELPEEEDFVLEFVTNKPWSGYNWYKGKYYSVIQINTDLPIYIDRAIDLAAHEGYPGHHVNNVLLEKNLVVDKKYLEFSIYPLFSPQSFIAEGSANYGIEVCFPDRLEYESKTLFPLAGIDPSLAKEYYQVEELVSKLSYAGNEAGRRYLEKRFTKEEAIQWLCDFAMMPIDRATKRISFFEAYRSYIINYNLGQDMVKKYVEGDQRNQDQKWETLKDIISNPFTASLLS